LSQKRNRKGQMVGFMYYIYMGFSECPSFLLCSHSTSTSPINNLKRLFLGIGEVEVEWEQRRKEGHSEKPMYI